MADLEAKRNPRDSIGTAGTEGTHVPGQRRAAQAGPKFSVGSWIKLHALDILTLAAMGALALGIYWAGPAPSRSFPLYNLDGSIMDPSIAWPVRRNIIPIWAAALISVLVPIIFFTLFQVKRKSAEDWLNTVLGLLKSVITAATFQVFIKWLIGGLRPHFLAICQPRIAPGDLSGAGFGTGFFDRSICTGNRDRIDEALQSMPSGHATAAWAGLFYLALYFNAQLKVMAAHNPAYWKMVMFFAPLLGAFLLSASLTVDKHHHWYDLVVGALIGIACALVAFRQTFASISDYRFNHVLLPRATSLLHRKPYLPFANRGPYYNYQHTGDFMSRDLPVSREGGWGRSHGLGEGSNGGPYDATALTTMSSGGMLGGGKDHYGPGFGGTGIGHDPRDPNVAADPLHDRDLAREHAHFGQKTTGTRTAGTGPLGRSGAPLDGHHAV